MAIVKNASSQLEINGTQTHSDRSTANTELTTTVAAVAGLKIRIHAFECVVSAADTGNEVNIILNSASTVLWETALNTGATIGDRTGLVFSTPIECAENEAFTLVSDAAGASSVIVNNLSYSIVPAES